MIGAMDQQSNGVPSDPRGVEHNGPRIKEIRPEDDEL